MDGSPHARLPRETQTHGDCREIPQRPTYSQVCESGHQSDLLRKVLPHETFGCTQRLRALLENPVTLEFRAVPYSYPLFACRLTFPVAVCRPTETVRIQATASGRQYGSRGGHPRGARVRRTGASSPQPAASQSIPAWPDAGRRFFRRGHSLHCTPTAPRHSCLRVGDERHSQTRGWWARP